MLTWFPQFEYFLLFTSFLLVVEPIRSGLSLTAWKNRGEKNRHQQFLYPSYWPSNCSCCVLFEFSKRRTSSQHILFFRGKVWLWPLASNWRPSVKEYRLQSHDRLARLFDRRHITWQKNASASSCTLAFLSRQLFCKAHSFVFKREGSNWRGPSHNTKKSIKRKRGGRAKIMANKLRGGGIWHVSLFFLEADLGFTTSRATSSRGKEEEAPAKNSR